MWKPPSYDRETEEFRVPLDPEGDVVLVSRDLEALDQALEWLELTGRYKGPFVPETKSDRFL